MVGVISHSQTCFVRLHNIKVSGLHNINLPKRRSCHARLRFMLHFPPYPTSTVQQWHSVFLACTQSQSHTVLEHYRATRWTQQQWLVLKIHSYQANIYIFLLKQYSAICSSGEDGSTRRRVGPGTDFPRPSQGDNSE